MRPSTEPRGQRALRGRSRFTYTRPRVLCDYCGNPAEMILGTTLYPLREDLSEKVFYRCVPCQAHVGCHPNSDQPLGRLANADLRQWKMRAHAAFDPLWRSGQMSRKQAYAWLAARLGLTVEETHIGMFDVELCRLVVEAVRERNRPAWPT